MWGVARHVSAVCAYMPVGDSAVGRTTREGTVLADLTARTLSPVSSCLALRYGELLVMCQQLARICSLRTRPLIVLDISSRHRELSVLQCLGQSP